MKRAGSRASEGEMSLFRYTWQEMIRDHMGLIRKVARGFASQARMAKLDLDDLESHGLEILWKRIDTYYTSRATSFASWARFVLKRAFARYCREEGTIRIPNNVSQAEREGVWAAIRGADSRDLATVVVHAEADEEGDWDATVAECRDLLELQQEEDRARERRIKCRSICRTPGIKIRERNAVKDVLLEGATIRAAAVRRNVNQSRLKRLLEGGNA